MSMKKKMLLPTAALLAAALVNLITVRIYRTFGQMPGGSTYEDLVRTINLKLGLITGLTVISALLLYYAIRHLMPLWKKGGNLILLLNMAFVISLYFWISWASFDRQASMGMGTLLLRTAQDSLLMLLAAFGLYRLTLLGAALIGRRHGQKALS